MGFFVQAEGGIGEGVASRRLGDVDKGQGVRRSEEVGGVRSEEE